MPPPSASLPSMPSHAEGVVMKQARMWLLIGAALLLLPEGAFAQKRGGNKPPAAPAPAPAGGAAPSGGGEIELDQPQATPGAPGAGAAAPGAPGAAPEAAGTGP